MGSHLVDQNNQDMCSDHPGSCILDVFGVSNVIIMHDMTLRGHRRLAPTSGCTAFSTTYSHTMPLDSLQTLPESYIQDAFHSYLKSSLTQAKVERLLDTDMLSSAEGDLMVTGPALCLYFAALRCTTSPPSVPLPRQGKASHG
jgi:hypothetical protein